MSKLGFNQINNGTFLSNLNGKYFNFVYKHFLLILTEQTYQILVTILNQIVESVGKVRHVKHSETGD